MRTEEDVPSLLGGTCVTVWLDLTGLTARLTLTNANLNPVSMVLYTFFEIVERGFSEF